MAAVEEERVAKLKQVLVESLGAILSPDQEVRKMAEDQLKVLEVTEEFGVHLAQLTVDASVVPGLRQLASVILKQYVEAHWCSHAVKYRPPETTDAAKAEIRQLLPLGLQDSLRKIRSSAAYAISAIAQWDWPEAWPGLFGLLMQALMSDDGNLVHGAMRVLTEFCHEVTDTQMPQVAPVILPEMYKIFVHVQKYSIRTRTRAVNIFNSCAGLMCMMWDSNREAAKQFLCPVLPQFSQAFIEALSVPDSDTSDSGLKMEVLKALTTLVKNFPKQMDAHLQQILPHVWTILMQSAERYVKTTVNYSEEADDPVDSDGEVLGFENLVISVFEFVHGLVETPKFKKDVKKHINDVVYFLLLYMQITEEQIQVWTANPNQFVEDEDDDTCSYSVRIAAQDVLLAVSAEFKKESAVALANAVQQHLLDANGRKTEGDPNWWKIHECCMLAMGCVRSLIIEKSNEGKLPVDMTSFLTEVVLRNLQQSASPFLIGQALWVASRFTSLMSQELLSSFLQAAVSGLQGPCAAISICAVRATFEFCAHLKHTGKTQLIKPYLPEMTQGLLALATQSMDDVLALVLESLRIVMSVDKEFTASCEAKITPLTIALFLKYSTDAAIVPLIEDLFKELAANQGCNKPLQHKFLPTLISILQAPPGKTPLGMNAVCLDILGNIVKCGEPPLSDALLNNVFPVLVSCILASDDNAVLQSGGECIRAYVAMGTDQVLSWHDAQGNGGLFYVVRATSHLLDPRGPEFTASFVGRLVTTLIQKIGENLGENLNLLLRGVLSKLQQAETLSVIQSLVLVFVTLFNTQLKLTLEFLSSVPDPQGKPALEYILKIWCARQPEFFGVFDTKVSTLALCNMLDFFVSTGDKRLQSIIVKGDRVFSQEGGVRTRSKAAKAPDQWTMIPVSAKVFKLIVNELRTLLENNEDGESEEGDDDAWEDVGDEEEDMSAQQSSLLGSPFAPASEYADYDMFDDIADEDEDDPLIRNDPIYSMDIQAHVVQFLHNFARHQCFSAYSQALNAQERQTLSKIGINVTQRDAET